MGKINRAWNDRGRRLSYWERRWADPLYKFREEVFYTQGITNGLQADIDDQPVKADRYGIFHGTSL